MTRLPCPNDRVRVGSMEMTREEAERCGLLPEQIEARRLRTIAKLEAIGHGRTPMASMLRKGGAK